MELIIDDRERAVIQYIDDPNIKVERIEVGDYCCMINDQVAICIERKTWKDLANSIKDGRTQNMEKMLSLREKTGCHLFYIIEGRVFNQPHTKFCGIEFKSLMAHLDHCFFKHQVATIYAKDISDVLPRIMLLIANYRSILPKKTLAGSQRSFIKERREKTLFNIACDMWCAVPGVSTKTAELLLRNRIFLHNIILGNIIAENISLIARPSGSEIGYHTARKIITNVDASSSAILMALPGISKKKAQTILAAANIHDIVDGKVKESDIGNIKYGNRRVGNKAAATIQKFLHHKSELFINDAAALFAASTADGPAAANDDGKNNEDDKDVKIGEDVLL